MDEQKKRGPKPGVTYRRGLTDKQSKFVTEVKRRVPEGALPTKRIFTEAVKAAYDVKDTSSHDVNSNASTLASQLLNNAKIQEALGLNAEGRKLYFETVFLALKGELPDHPKDKELMMKAMQILARYFVPAEEHTTIRHDDSFTGRSDAELDFFIAHGYWPDQKP